MNDYEATAKRLYDKLLVCGPENAVAMLAAALEAERDGDFVKGLKRALELAAECNSAWTIESVIEAEIDKALQRALELAAE